VANSGKDLKQTVGTVTPDAGEVSIAEVFEKAVVSLVCSDRRER
jgi:hypothetical protein